MAADKLAIFDALTHHSKAMKPTALAAAVILFGTAIGATAQGVRILPRPNAVVDGSVGTSVKRMPAGGEFLLTVNKGGSVAGMEIQWFKDGVALEGETGQELRRPIASLDMNGVYTVSMKSPCATVMSQPIQVLVGPVQYRVDSKPADVLDPVAGRVQDVGTQTASISDITPNPASDRVTVHFTTTTSEHVNVSVVDLNGRVVAPLVNTTLGSGQHEVVLDLVGHNMSQGLYYVVVNSAGNTVTKSLVVTR